MSVYMCCPPTFIFQFNDLYQVCYWLQSRDGTGQGEGGLLQGVPALGFVTRLGVPGKVQSCFIGDQRSSSPVKVSNVDIVDD